MQPIEIYDKESTESTSGNLLAAVEGRLGFVPNVFTAIAESSCALKAFMELNSQFEESTLNETSREIIQIVVSIENQSPYCITGHSVIAEMQNISGEIIAAIQNNQPIADSKLEALNQFTRLLVRKKGMVSQIEIQKFLDAGYTPENVIEVILGICVKTFSNLTSNVTDIPLDDEFIERSWKTNPWLIV